MISARGQRQDTSRNHILIKRGDPLHRVLNIRRVRPDITKISAVHRLKRTHSAHAMLRADHCRSIAQLARPVAWAGTVRCSAVPRHPDDAHIDIRPARVTARQMRQPHKCRNARKAWQVHPRHWLKKMIVHVRSLSLLRAVTAPSPCSSIRSIAAKIGS